MATTNPSPGAFGVEVRGLNLEGGLNADEFQFLTKELYDNQVLIVKKQSFTKDGYLVFGRQWGTPIPHVLDHMRMDGYPEMMTVGNTEKRDEQDTIRNGAALWHTDQSYEKVPASVTMLYSIKAPTTGGETQFCNMARAYDGLDAATKTRIENYEVAHKYGKGRRLPEELTVNPIINDEQDQRVPPIYHPLVLRHPVCDRKALYALGHGAHGIKGWTDDESLEFIDELKRHVLQERYIYRHKYEPGDLVIWDTLQTMHSATPIDIVSGEDNARLLWRISVRGKPDIYK